LKVEIKTDKEKITYSDTEIKVDLSSIYLFGSPASNLKAKVTYRFNSVSKTFKKYSNYTFSNDLKNFSSSFKNLINSELDNNGKKKAILRIPNLKDIPSALSLELKAEVLEKGGRPNKDSKQISYDPYKSYVGIERPERSYIKTGDTEMINTILLSSNGSPVVGQQMTVKIYYNNRYWWWDYNRRRNKLNFRNDYETDLVVEEKFISGKEPYKIKFNPKESGKYLIEVIQSMDKLHSASYFINSSYWGNSTKDINDAGLLALTTNQKTYKPGETAVVKFPTSPESRVIVSIDKGAKNLDFYGVESAGNETTLKIPITANMLPNIYCSISVIQPNSQRKNDRPIRSYGTISLNVEDKNSHSEIELDVPEVIKPNEKFKVKLQTKDKKQTQFTLAVVDEGLLSITDFSTPDPWKFFYNKLRLGVSFFDNYDYVINSNKGDVLNTFSVGGGMDMMSARKKMLSNVKANRFIPVSMFKGPMKTDKNGYAEVELNMSEYIGAVRIMAISADKEKFGSDEVSVPVRSELMVLPSIPRSLSPHDEFDLPVTIFSMEESIKNVKVTLKLEGPLTSEILTKEVIFNGKETKNIQFRLTAKDQIGKAKIKITATAGKFKTESNTEIAVKPLSPRVFRSFTEKCSKGSEVKFELPKDVLQGTENVSITVSKAKIPNVYRRINFLIGYPYGCLEQTTSKGFAQLSVKDLLKEHSRFNETIDDNINSTINRLRGFQFDNGSLSYWMNERDSYSAWSDIFAGHFLWEAKRKGYFVPVDLWKNWKRNMHSQALKARVEKISNWVGWNSDLNSDNDKRSKYRSLRTQLYRLYVLAMIEEPEIGQMNIIKEMNLSYMDDTERWILAACYHYAGLTDIAQNIVSTTGILVKEYSEMSGTFGSELRDKGIILNCLTLMDKEGQATDLYNSIVDRLNSDEWMSTQTSAFAMLSVGKYMEKYKSYFSSEGKYSIAIKDIKFSSDKMSITKEIKNFSDNIIVSMGADSDLESVYVTMNWDGIPQNPTEVREGKGLIIERTWYDDNGNQIKNTTSKSKLLNKLFNGSNKLVKPLKQGQVFKMRIKVKKRTQAELKNMALMQIIPSGWEIENKRLDNANAYSSANSVRNYGYNSSYNYNRKQSIKYVDIRDDRAMWFFDLDKNVKEIEFEIDLRCVSTGKFYMSPTIAESMYSREYYIIEPGFEVEVEK
nr:hypothetical protein [Candidatus Delongbacteria bacterium]